MSFSFFHFFVFSPNQLAHTQHRLVASRLHAACGFWLLLAPFDLESVFREQFTPFVKLLFHDESLLSTSVPQDFSRVESDECPGSAEKGRSSFRGLCYSDEPF